ncbi:MAG: response regulator, partial [Sedimenticola sp.]
QSKNQAVYSREAFHGVRALVVDDNNIARKVLCEMLASASFQTESVTSGQEAIDELNRAVGEGRPYGLVIMDWKMPGMDGVEATRRIKQEQHLSQTPTIIMVTAHGHEEVMRQAEQVGMDGFLLKPVSPSQLFDSIIEILHEEKSAFRPVTLAHHSHDQLQGKVLLVEDNSINQQVAQEILNSFGVTVQVAENGWEALDALSDKPFDLVLMDIQMPGMDGYEATRRIRRNPEWAGLPLVAMTAHAMAGDREKCLKVGMDDYISKPIDPNALFQALIRHLGGDAPLPAEKPPGDDLPDGLPGIDIDQGLQRIGGNRKLFQKLLRDFLGNHGDSVRELEDALAAERNDEARRMAHTIKGVAGTLGAERLYLKAADLERAIATAEEIPRKMDEFVAAFSEFKDGLVQWLGDPAIGTFE